MPPCLGAAIHPPAVNSGVSRGWTFQRLKCRASGTAQLLIWYGGVRPHGMPITIIIIIIIIIIINIFKVA